MKFIFSLNLKGLFKEKKEKKKKEKSQIEDYLSSIKIQMLSYSFFETLFYYFFVVIKLDMFLFNCNRNCLTTQQFISKKIFNFLCFFLLGGLWGRKIQPSSPKLSITDLNLFIYWKAKLLGKVVHLWATDGTSPSKCYFPMTYTITRDL